MIKPLLCRKCRIEIKRGNGAFCILCRKTRGKKSFSQEYNSRMYHKEHGLKGWLKFDGVA